MKKFYPRILYSLLLLLSHTVYSQSVWTQHNDQGRTGWYPYENTLNTSNVNTNTFGLSFNHITDDKIVAQPLVVLNVNIPNKGFKNVVFVATLNNTIYAYDADVNAEPYWQQNYTNKIAPSPNPDCVNCRPAFKSDIHPSLCGGSYGDFTGNMGIIGTPVIDTAQGTMYFVTKIVNPNDGTIDNHAYMNNIKDEYNYTTTGFHQYLHAIDITTGIEKPNSPVEITATTTGTGDGQTSPGIVSFDPRRQFNRAGLALSQGMVYIAFAAHCDNNPSHGWLLAYSAATLTQVHSYNATPNDGRGGIWMSGTAPAVDATGYIYFTTGNSLDENRTSQNYNTYTASATDPLNRGESVIKLAPDLTMSSYFTPFNFIALNDADKDFPMQVMLLPNTNLAMTGCKDDSLYIFDRNNLGGFDPYKNNTKQRVNVQSSASMHSTFAYFGGPTAYAYQYSENSQLKAYPVSTNGLGTAITNTAIAGPSGYMGGFLSVSSNGGDPATGVLWAYQAINGCNANGSECHGLLHAINASDITKELWNSEMNSTDVITVFNKFSCPTIALGKVYLAANRNMLCVYGLKANTSCLTNVALHKPATVLTTAGGTASNTTDGDITTGWRSAAHNVDSIYIDLGSSYDICKVALTWEANRYGKDFDLKVSDDGIHWTIVHSVRGNTSTYTEYNGSFSGRYVSMVGITQGTTLGYSIYEFQVFGNPASSCRAPSGLSAAGASNSTVHISWDPNAGATQYIVKYRPNLSASWLTRTTTTNSIDLTALSCGPIYYYTVQANCGAAQSAVSPGSFSISGCPATGCDILPVRYFNVDLGDIGMAGSTCKNGNTWTVTGSGADIGGVSDAFQFAYTNDDIVDYDVYGRITQQDLSNPLNKIGIMVRDSLTNSSRFAFLASVNNGYNINFEYRDIPSAVTTTIPLPGHYALPYWMKLSKLGTQYSAFISADGISWNPAGGPVDLHFGLDPGNAPHYGMAMTSANNTSLSSGKIDNFNVVASTTLPILLQSFGAKNINNDHVLISWSTSMEHLVDHYEVQRSADNSSFQTIGKVKAVGESETVQYYSMNDPAPSDGINYYRLKELDRDANFYLSPVVSVKFNEQQGLGIYPNPADNFTNITTARESILEISVFDVTGKLMQHVVAGDKQKLVRLNTSGLSSGIYIITVKTASAVYRQKLIRQ
jgi:hypothetical protein